MKKKYLRDFVKKKSSNSSHQKYKWKLDNFADFLDELFLCLHLIDNFYSVPFELKAFLFNHIITNMFSHQ